MELSLENFLSQRVAGVNWKSAEAVLALTAEGATVPFIARYRKEKTKNLDEVQIRLVIETADEYQEIIKRKEFILKEIEEQGNLTTELKARIRHAWELSEIEELYRPYKQKKKTKATLARDAGIGPFADWLWELGQTGVDPGTTLEVKAKDFINPAKKFVTYEEVLRGAHNIIVERLANEPELRLKVAERYFATGVLESKPGKKVKAKSKYENYFAYKESIKSLFEKKNSHRYLAMRRGWKEGELTVTVSCPEDEALIAQYKQLAHPAANSLAKAFLALDAEAAYNVHVQPSVVNEVHKKLKDQADIIAIDVFAENVRKLLLASPFGARCVLGVDPGLRTGCKIALVDDKGVFISHTVLKIQGEKAEENAKALFEQVLKQIEIDAIAVGNGTGGRETEVFLRKILKAIGKEVPVVMVNESGASIYSASDVAREEFPDLDLTVRGAISIARRLQDPLAELVKIEPKSIGVGQYQHDVSQTTLKKRLDAVVEHCVNKVGVNVNTASEHLLQYIAGIGPGVAKSIVQYRKENGLFKTRDDLTKVPKYSSKVFEQSAGFLRIPNGTQKLDSTGIHPERYRAVKDMASEAGLSLSAIIGEGAQKILELRTKWAALVGEYTFDDIVQELQKPGRDPRDPYKVFQFRDDIFAVKDLQPGMICNGIVTNVTNFGAFVDIGVHQDGLVHISELGHTFIQNTQQFLSPGDQVQVRVLKVDQEKNQISLTMKLTEAPATAKRHEKTATANTSDNRDRKQSARKGGQRDERKGDPRDERKGGQRDERKGDPRDERKGGQRDERKGGQRDERKGDRPQQGGKPRQPTKPFNNPFAALSGIKVE